MTTSARNLTELAGGGPARSAGAQRGVAASESHTERYMSMAREHQHVLIGLAVLVLGTPRPTMGGFVLRATSRAVQGRLRDFILWTYFK